MTKSYDERACLKFSTASVQTCSVLIWFHSITVFTRYEFLSCPVLSFPTANPLSLFMMCLSIILCDKWSLNGFPLICLLVLAGFRNFSGGLLALTLPPPPYIKMSLFMLRCFSNEDSSSAYSTPVTQPSSRE